MPTQRSGFDLRAAFLQLSHSAEEFGKTYGVDKGDACEVDVVLRVLFDDFRVVDGFGSNILMACARSESLD
jgi:hypothetical protein